MNGLQSSWDEYLWWSCFNKVNVFCEYQKIGSSSVLLIREGCWWGRDDSESYNFVQFKETQIRMVDMEGTQTKKKNLIVEPGAGPSSLFILSDTNYLRRFTMFLIEWPPFEYTILLTIIGKLIHAEGIQIIYIDLYFLQKLVYSFFI